MGIQDGCTGEGGWTCRRLDELDMQAGYIGERLELWMGEGLEMQDGRS